MRMDRLGWVCSRLASMLLLDEESTSGGGGGGGGHCSTLLEEVAGERQAGADTHV